MRVLLFLFYLATISSQSAMDFFASLIAVFVIHSWWRSPGEFQSFLSRWKDSALRWPLGALLLWIVGGALSLVPAASESPMAMVAITDFKWTLSLFFFCGAIIHFPRAFRSLRWPLVFFALASLYSIVIWYFRYDPLDPANDFSPWSGGVRSGGLLSNPMVFAHMYGLHLAVWLGILVTGLSVWRRSIWLLLLSSLIASLAILVSFTRGVWMALTASSLILSFIRSWKLGLAALGLLGALGFSLFLMWSDFSERTMDLSKHGDERRIIWQAHWELFKENPVWGVGLKQTKAPVQKKYADWGAPPTTQFGHAHNQYLHWLASLGIFGALGAISFFVLMWLLTLRLYLKIRRTKALRSIDEGLALGLLWAQTFWFFGAITESNFEHSKIRYVLTVIWALVIHLHWEYASRAPSIGSQGVHGRGDPS